MWTKRARDRMACGREEGQALPERSDRWGMEPYRTSASRAGAARMQAGGGGWHEVQNAIHCMARSGGGWRMLPKDFPPWQTVYW